ncbi:ribosome-dependent ATPase [Parvibaculum indicum]|uniref:ribosome-associated ATPase/putative transporter RbbA n=1 Tax=Parvibaculum indicum TaxID=562969 RepID=UPI00141F9FC4|nr:ribosome-associated ATPase/putative transporter RbbA [Parvibaculum indicum]NIJ41376.1 ribosome-dependent ATPase [Parvibaculum indicum]
MQEVAPKVAQIRSLTHRYGDNAALEDVSLDIPAGCMAGLIGPDGVGKSTLLAILAGVRRIQSGQVNVLDGDMTDRVHRSRCHVRIAYMPQGLGKNLYPTLSVEENLDFFGRLFGLTPAARRERIDELLAATGLAPFPHRAVGALSGGMKQKLGLCCALIHDPDLLILDEPTTGVDPLSRRQFWELIDHIRARRPQMSVLVATAYMEEAERFDWLAAMDDGHILATGTPDEVRRAGGHETLEEAFIELLPEERRKRHRAVTVPPRQADGDTAAIEAEGLTRRFGDFVAVDNVSFRIEPGEIFGFLGSNGCGKTTTMKMLTGLLPASEGVARLFGKPLDARDMATRQRVGYMSQSFSLYSELTVRQNLELHAHIFELPYDEIEPRVLEMLKSFELEDVEHSRPDDLPLGIKQRLQLAVAVIHRPEVLILDEPTSGVDPIARDQFWQYLLDLSRNDGVTIFISTHFMNEAERCDRVSLMHAGRVLAVGVPRDLAESSGGGSLEEAFVEYLEKAAAPSRMTDGVIGRAMPEPDQNGRGKAGRRSFSLQRLWAYTRREAMELLRDPIRLTFALAGPVILLLAFGYGITFDVEDLPYAVFDQDQSLESRTLIEGFEGSRYFDEKTPARSETELIQRLKSGEIVIGVEIPSGFGRDLLGGHHPEINLLVDAASPFRGETAAGYVSGIAQQYLAERYPGLAANIFSVETRMRYNQAFKSVYAIVPSVFTLILTMIPAMMTAVGVVREKEYGSIANFRSTPVTRLEFLLGKQGPYIVLAYINFLTLLAMAVFIFGVPVKGSLPALLLGSLLYVAGTTGFGVLISSFTNTQVAAMFGAAIISIIPAVNFSGLLVPVSSLSGAGQIIGLSFPSGWYQPISVGAMTKGLHLSDMWTSFAMLVLFALAYLFVARIALRKQER